MTVYYSTGAQSSTGDTTSSFDANGNLIKVVDKLGTDVTRDFVVNTQGQVLKKTEGTNTEYYFYANGAPVGSVGGTAADFDYNYTPVSDHYPSTTPTSYVVNSGDSLQSIALSLYGDANLWYLIADANGLTSANLAGYVGKSITIPNRVTNVHNSYQTFKPYSPGEIIGDTTPTVPNPPPPAQSSGGGCGVAQIIVAIVTIVVAYFTAGALLGVLGEVGSAMAGAAIGSVAGQLTGMALGVQDKFSWGAVASAALTAGIMPSIPAGEGLTGQIVSGVTRNLVSQGINIITGQQQEFSWASLATAAVMAPINAKIGPTSGGKSGLDISFDEFASRVGKEMLKSALTQSVQIAFNGGGKFSWSQVASDGFGQAIGNSIVDQMKFNAGEPATNAEHQERELLAGMTPAERRRYMQEKASIALDGMDLNKGGSSMAGALYDIEKPGYSGPPDPNNACFVAGTLVHTKEGLRPIETIAANDWVAARHQANGSGPIRWRKVVEIFQFGDKAVVQLLARFSDGITETISATYEHPFFVNGAEWTRAENLVPGDRFELVNGSQAVLIGKEAATGRHTVFNFMVEEDHTYFVGERGIWVHNLNLSYAEFRAGIEASAGEAKNYLSYLQDKAFEKADDFMNGLRERNPELAKGLDIFTESFADLKAAVSADLKDASPDVVADVVMTLGGIFLAPESGGLSLAVSAGRVANRVSRIVGYGETISDVMSVADKFKLSLPEDVGETVKKLAGEFATETIAKGLPGFEDQSMRDMVARYLNKGAEKIAWFSNTMINSKNKIAKVSGVLFGMAMRYYDVAEKLTQTFFDYSGLFKDRDAKGNQQSGPLQNRSNQGLDYAGLARTGLYANQFLVFDVKSSWNGRAKGMAEGANTMARRVTASALDWGLPEAADYAKHMNDVMGRRPFTGYLIQFDHLGNRSVSNHVRINQWK